MADIYIDATSITNSPPTRKAYRELRTAYAQVIGTLRDFNNPFAFEGVTYNPGVIIITNNAAPDPDEAAIIALIQTHDGSQSPPSPGLLIPRSPNFGALPPSPGPPGPGRVLVRATRTPNSLYAWDPPTAAWIAFS